MRQMRPPNRTGATLPELLVGLVVSMLVVMTAFTSALRYQRSSSTIDEWMNVRSQLRDATDILAADLRGISVIGDSILAASDTAVEFRSALGSSVVCTVASGSRITLPPDSLLSDRVLSSWVMPPDSGDTLLAYLGATGVAPARWVRLRIVAFAPAPAAVACPPSAGLLDASDVAGAGSAYDVTLEGSAPELRRGAPIRIVRRVRYSVYRGGDGHWYLGYRRCTTSCAAIQPVSGPYQVPGGTAPIALRYFDRSGARVSTAGPMPDPSSVEVTVRSNFVHRLWFPGLPARTGDTIRSVIAFRNSR